MRAIRRMEFITTIRSAEHPQGLPPYARFLGPAWGAPRMQPQRDPAAVKRWGSCLTPTYRATLADRGASLCKSAAYSLQRDFYQAIHTKHRWSYDTACSIMQKVTQADKILERMRNNPRDWRIESLETVAKRFGIVVRKPPGSHVVFQHDASVLEVSVPGHRPIKPVYVKQFLALIDDLRS